MMRRLHARYIIIIFVALILTIYNLYLFYPKNGDAYLQLMKCRIYDKYDSKCVRMKDTIYFPTSDVLSLFDIYGYFDKISNTYYLKSSNVNLTSSNLWNYEYFGRFLFFEKYEVDIRSKVKVISIEGVPISSQWNKDGYYYPIQIAQYGLSHFSKWISLKQSPTMILPLNLLDLLDTRVQGKKKFVKSIESKIFFTSNVFIHEHNLNRLKTLYSHGNNINMQIVGDYLKIMPKILSDLPELFVLGEDWLEGSGIHILLKNSDFGFINLVYICGNIPQYEENNFLYVYNIKNCKNFKLVRNIYVDIIKLMPLKITQIYGDYKIQLKTSEMVSITLFGQGKLSVFKLCNQFSYDKFIVAAEWFVTNQDDNGGWRTNVTRKIYPDVKLSPGWYSAMAQGHGISLLTRAYNVTKDVAYLRAATKALELFKIDAEDHGIVAKFLGRKDLVWYEEYPTNPSLFVLNGFLYSLFGLLDYTRVDEISTSKHVANELFLKGITSLKTILPLFDSGFGSFYDLRHLTFPISNIKISKKSVRKWEVQNGPNRARWEYHLIHTEQLMYLANCFHPEDEFLMETAHRFLMYLKGYRSSHN